MSAYFEVHKSKDDKFVFNLKAANNEVILTGQTYSSKQHALDGIESVRQNSTEDARYERKTSTASEPFFVLSGANGIVIGSSQMYSSTDAMEGGIASVKANGQTKTTKDAVAT
ncbi:MAG: YegP family protein [Betaproteobacteria bacterium]